MNRLTIRLRLTVLFGVLVFLAGFLMLTVTYVLVERHLAPAAASVDMLRVLRRRGFATVVGVGLAAAGCAYLMSGRALRPLRRITETARRISGADAAGRGLHERIALTGPPDEIKDLADAFDVMVGRLDRAFDGQRRFVANASHELRTPLTINRSLVELAITRPAASDDTKRLGEDLLAVNERHERLIDALLTLADAEQALSGTTPVDLAAVVAHVLRDTPAVRRDLRPAATTGDAVLLEQLAQNLVGNAVQHNVPDGTVDVTTATVDGRATLTVTNTGPAVPEYEIERLFQPFQRLDRRRVAGARGFGLGLSIVRAIAAAHGGDARARPGPGGGLAVTVTLPGHADRLR